MFFRVAIKRVKEAYRWTLQPCEIVKIDETCTNTGFMRNTFSPRNMREYLQVKGVNECTSKKFSWTFLNARPIACNSVTSDERKPYIYICTTVESFRIHCYGLICITKFLVRNISKTMLLTGINKLSTWFILMTVPAYVRNHQHAIHVDKIEFQKVKIGILSTYIIPRHSINFRLPYRMSNFCLITNKCILWKMDGRVL